MKDMRNFEKLLEIQSALVPQTGIYTIWCTIYNMHIQITPTIYALCIILNSYTHTLYILLLYYIGILFGSSNDYNTFIQKLASTDRTHPYSILHTLHSYIHILYCRYIIRVQQRLQHLHTEAGLHRQEVHQRRYVTG